MRRARVLTALGTAGAASCAWAAVKFRARPSADRDWSRIDELLDMLQESADISDAQIAMLRADVLVRKGETAAAEQLLAAAAEANRQDPQLVAALTTLALRDNDLDKARAALA